MAGGSASLSAAAAAAAAAPSGSGSGGRSDDDDSADNKSFNRVPPPSSSSSYLENGGGGGGGMGNRDRPRSPVAETLFRKDLISAMKLPDNEPLTSDDYWVVADTWKQEWERGVQVPFKPDALPEPRVSRLANPPHSTDRFAL